MAALSFDDLEQPQADPADQFADRILQSEHSHDDQVSPKGAQAAYQVMPRTQVDPGFGVTPAKNNTPEEIDREGRDYAKALYNHYGNPVLAAAAYNAGPGNTDSWIKKYGDPRSGKISDQDFVNKIPSGEAKAYAANYVPSSATSGPLTFDDVAPGSTKAAAGAISFDDLAPPQDAGLLGTIKIGLINAARDVGQGIKKLSSDILPANLPPGYLEQFENEGAPAAVQPSVAKFAAAHPEIAAAATSPAVQAPITAQQPIDWSKPLDPKSVTEKMAYDVTQMVPMVVGAMGGIPGAAIAVGTQSLGQNYQNEIQKTPNDPAGATKRAYENSAADAAITALSFKAFEYMPFKTEVGSAINDVTGEVAKVYQRTVGDLVKNLATQGLGIQGAISVADQGIHNWINGRPLTEGMPNAYAQGAIPTTLMLGVAHIISPSLPQLGAWRPPAAGETTPYNPSGLEGQGPIINQGGGPGGFRPGGAGAAAQLPAPPPPAGSDIGLRSPDGSIQRATVERYGANGSTVIVRYEDGSTTEHLTSEVMRDRAAPPPPRYEAEPEPAKPYQRQLGPDEGKAPPFGEAPPDEPSARAMAKIAGRQPQPMMDPQAIHALDLADRLEGAATDPGNPMSTADRMAALMQVARLRQQFQPQGEESKPGAYRHPVAGEPAQDLGELGAARAAQPENYEGQYVRQPFPPSRDTLDLTPYRPMDLLQFLGSRGGLQPDDPYVAGNLQAMDAHKKFLPGTGMLVRKPGGGGMSMEEAREAAQEWHYGDGYNNFDGTTDLMNAIKDALGGKDIFSSRENGGLEAAMAWQAHKADQRIAPVDEQDDRDNTAELRDKAEHYGIPVGDDWTAEDLMAAVNEREAVMAERANDSQQAAQHLADVQELNIDHHLAVAWPEVYGAARGEGIADEDPFGHAEEPAKGQPATQPEAAAAVGEHGGEGTPGKETGPPGLGGRPGDRGQVEAAPVEAPAEPVEPTAHRVQLAEQNAEPEPSQAQIEAENYKHGHVVVQGVPISIENATGSVRGGVGPDGRPWAVTLQYPYGKVKRSEGGDGEQIDVYIGPHPDSPDAFVVDQIDPKTGEWDEHKAVLGARTEEQAMAIYDAGFSDGSGPERAGAITAMPIDEFKKWAESGPKREPLSYSPPAIEAVPPKDVGRQAAEDLKEASATSPARADPVADETEQTIDENIPTIVPEALDDPAWHPAGETEEQPPAARRPHAAGEPERLPAPEAEGRPVAAPEPAGGRDLAGEGAAAQPPTGVRVTENKERNGVEVKFPGRPPDDVLGKLKAAGFRWSKPQKLWYAKRSDRTLAVANSLKGEPAKPFTTTPGAIAAEHAAEVSSLEAQGTAAAAPRPPQEKMAEWAQRKANIVADLARKHLTATDAEISRAIDLTYKAGLASHEAVEQVMAEHRGSKAPPAEEVGIPVQIQQLPPIERAAAAAARLKQYPDAGNKGRDASSFYMGWMDHASHVPRSAMLRSNDVVRRAGYEARQKFKETPAAEKSENQTLADAMKSFRVQMERLGAARGPKGDYKVIDVGFGQHKGYAVEVTENGARITLGGVAHQGLWSRDKAIQEAVERAFGAPTPTERAADTGAAEAARAEVDASVYQPAAMPITSAAPPPKPVDLFSVGDAVVPKPENATDLPPRPGPRYVTDVSPDGNQVTLDGGAILPSTAVEPTLEHGVSEPIPSRPAGQRPETVPGVGQERPNRPAPSGEDSGSLRPAGRPVGTGAKGTGRTPSRSPSTALGGGTGDGANAGLPDTREGPEPGTSGRPDALVRGENFQIEPGEIAEGRGPKAKAADNLAAINLVKRLIAEDRPATRDEQAILARYVGWGGLSGAFQGSDGKFGTGFDDIGRQLKDVLTPDEYRTASQSTQYAHYTAENVIRSMWDAVSAMGFTGGSVFEPGMGVGHFLGMMPPDIAAKSQYEGIELDHLTADIAKHLYPQSGVRQANFVDTPMPENTFDLVIGNPPFSDTIIKADPKYSARGFMLHDYFFAKSLDSVRPGGLLAFVTSAGTMNKLNDSARRYLAERSAFLGGVRLPSNAFKKNAGTEVTTDVLFFQKYPEDMMGKLEKIAGGDLGAWTETVQRELPNADGGKTKGNVSRYFSEHPEQVLGREGFFDKLYKDRYAVHADDNTDLTEGMQRALANLPKDIYKPPLTPYQKAEIDFASGEHKDGSFYMKGNQLMQYEGGVGRAVPSRGPGVEGGVTAKDMEKIKHLIPVRDALRDVFSHDLAERPQDAAVAREQLNRAYDAFTRKYGPINLADYQYRRPNIIQQESARAEAREIARDRGEVWREGSFNAHAAFGDEAKLSEIARARQEARARHGAGFDEGSFNPAELPDIVIEKRPNIDPFMDDQESYRLRAIEDYDEKTRLAKKRRVFFESVLTKEQEPVINSANDGVLWSLNKFGRFDVDAIARKMGRDRHDIITELGDKVYKVPGTDGTYQTSDEYLSGDILTKLDEARAVAQHDPSVRRNLAALEAAIPAPLAPSEISMRIGMPWIPAQYIENFAANHLKIGQMRIRHNAALGGWVIKSISDGENTTLWGTPDMSAEKMLGAVLNRRAPRIYSEVRDADGSKRRVFDPVATQAVQDKFNGMRNAFAEYPDGSNTLVGGLLYDNPKLAEELATIYNNTLNRSVLRVHDGSYLTTPGVASDWSWRPHQKRGVARVVQTGNTYLAHAVGSGKTSLGIGAIMEMRRLGLVNKPMIPVPNHMLGQWAKEFYEQYPTAKIMVADERRFHTSRRKQFIANVAQADIDAVIITHSAFGKIPISAAFQKKLIEEELDQLAEAMKNLDKQDDRITIKRLENQKEKLEQKIKAGTGGNRKDQTNTFEEMGIDFLLVDESHLFRKLQFSTKQSGLKGVDPDGSDAAFDLYSKIRYLESKTPGRSAVLMSGTPVTNTMAELFSISRYLQRGELQDRGIDHFDSWASTFGDTKQELEQTADGGYQSMTRFARFVNIPELFKMVGQVMDIVTPNQLDQYVVRPKLKGGKRNLVIAPRTDFLDEYQAELASRMQAIKNRRGPPKKGDDIMLSVINDGRKAAIDPRFIMGAGANAEAMAKDSKLSIMIDNVHKVWEKTKDVQFYDPKSNYQTPTVRGPATQMIFANIGVNPNEDSNGFSVYGQIKKELLAKGIPPTEVAFIRDYKSHVARQKLFNDMNDGKVRILIGSTQKMGTGVNAQRRLYAIHNMDPLWYPADDEQRVGRGLRQGNWNPEIEIHDYTTKGTYDSAMWKMMGRKARFIEQFFRGDPELRDMEDLGEASQYEQASAMSTSDPRMMELTDLRQNLDRAVRREQAHDREQYTMRSQLQTAHLSVESYGKKIPIVEADIAKRKLPANGKFEVVVGNKRFDDINEAGKAAREIYDKEWPTMEGGKDLKLGNYGGFDFYVHKPEKTFLQKPFYFFERSNGKEADLEANTPIGAIRSMVHRLDGLENEIKWLQDSQAENQQKIKSLESQIGKPFTGGDEIKRLRDGVRNLEAELAPKTDAEKMIAARKQVLDWPSTAKLTDAQLDAAARMVLDGVHPSDAIGSVLTGEPPERSGGIKAQVPTLGPANDEAGVPHISNQRYFAEVKKLQDGILAADKNYKAAVWATKGLKRNTPAFDAAWERRFAARRALNDAIAELHVYQHRAGSPLHDYAGLKAQAPAAPFYSALTRSVGDIKQEKAQAKQWEGIIDNLKGVKKEEIDWSGVKEWLADQKGPVSKADLLNFLRDNEIQIKEVLRGGEVPREAIQKISDWLDEKYGKADENAEVTSTDLDDARRGDSEAIGKLEGLGVPGELLQPIYDHINQGATKFGTGQGAPLPGGENYRELLLTLPEMKSADLGAWRAENPKNGVYQIVHSFGEMNSLKERGWIITDAPNERAPAFRSGHFDEPNVLAHVRFDDRTGTNGEKILHLAEVQSDWHQKGRHSGYKIEPQSTIPYVESDKLHIIESAHDWQAVTPDGRFTASVGKGTVSNEAEARRYLTDYINKDKIRPTNAENLRLANAGVPNAPFKTTWPELAFKRMLRYAAANGYDRLSWDTGDTNADRYDLSKQVDAISWNPKTQKMVIEKDGVAHDVGVVPKEKLPDHIGKEAANKIVDQRVDKDGDHVLQGEGLKVGGEGMRGFYDKILPDFARKYVKKWGAKVEDSEITTPQEVGLRIAGDDDEGWKVVRRDGSTAAWVGSEQEARNYIDDNDREDYVPVHSIAITPAMRDSVMAGQPLFHKGDNSIWSEIGGTKRLAPDFYAQLPRIPSDGEAQLIEQVNRILKQVAPGAKVVPAKELTYRGNKIWGATYTDGGRSAIAWSLESPSAAGTAHHEAIHWLRNLGFFTPEEWKTLTDSAVNYNWFDTHNIEARYPNLDIATQAEEAIAEEYSSWARRESTPPPNVRTIFGRIRDALGRIAKYLRSLFGTGVKAEDIFKKVLSGEIGSREPQDKWKPPDSVFAQAAKTPEGPVETPAEGRDYIDATTDDLAEHMRSKGPGTYERTLQGMSPPSGPELFHRANFLQREFMGPRTVAEIDTKSGKFWAAIQKEEDEASQRLHDLRDNIRDNFLKLPRENHDRVNAVMEIDRLDSRTRSDDGRSIIARNTEFPNARGSKPGDSIILSPEETKAYFGLQRMYRQAWDNIMEGSARRMGWIRPWSPSMTDNFKLIERAISEADGQRNRKAFQRIHDVLTAMEEQRRAAYMPMMRFGDYYFSVTPKYDKESTGGFPESVWFSLAERPAFQYADVDPVKMFKGEITQTGQVPDHAKDELAQLQAKYPAKDFRINHGYLLSKPDMLRQMSIPAIEKLMTLLESGVLDRLKSEASMEGFANRGAAYKKAKEDWGNLYEELVDAVRDEMYEQLKSGFKKRSRTVPGYDSNFNRVLGTYMGWTSRHVARQIHGDTVERLYDDIQTNHPHESIRDYWKKWKQDDDDPLSPLSRIGMGANQIGFLWTMAMNPASTFSIAMHGPTYAVPTLGTGIGVPKAAAAFAKAYGEATAAIRWDEKHGAIIDITKVGKTPDERAFLKEMAASGYLHAKGADDIRSMAEKSSAIWGDYTPHAQKAMDIVSSNIAVADQANRVAASLAGYRLARDGNLGHMNATWAGNQIWRAISNAEGVSAESMGKFLLNQSVGEWGGRSRSRFGRSFMGRMGSSLHGFQIRFLSNLIKQAFRQGGAGRIALAWSMAALWAAAGLQGLPFVQDAENAMDYIWKALTKHDPMLAWRLRAMLVDIGLGKTGADVVMRGPLSTATGIDFASRLGFGDVISRDVAPWFGAGNEAALTFPSIVFGSLKAFSARKGSHQPAAAAASLLPGALRHPVQAVIDAEHGAKSQTGKTMYVPARKFTTADEAKEAAGFTPLDVERAREHADFRYRAAHAHGRRPQDTVPR